jgi:class 3 adenylate cyclase
VILARRLCDAACGGDVIVPEQMRVFAESIAAELTPLGPLTLKGLSQPVTANAMRLPPLALSA